MLLVAKQGFKSGLIPEAALLTIKPYPSVRGVGRWNELAFYLKY